jgi:hypothetical protein
MKKNLLILTCIIFFSQFSIAQNFGDSYYSVKSRVTNIISSIPNGNITCEYNIEGIEGQKIYGFDENGKLASLITRQYLSEADGETLYYGIYKKYNSMFGTASIDNKREYCSDCPKLKSKWKKGSESMIVTYYSLNGESLVQTMYIRKKGIF